MLGPDDMPSAKVVETSVTTVTTVSGGVGGSGGGGGGGREEGILLVDVDSRTALCWYQHYYIITVALPISLPGVLLLPLEADMHR